VKEAKISSKPGSDRIKITSKGDRRTLIAEKNLAIVLSSPVLYGFFKQAKAG
jgi:hypothetical protein